MQRAEAEQIVSQIERVPERFINAMLPVAEKLTNSSSETPERLIAAVLAQATKPQQDYSGPGSYESRPRGSSFEGRQYGNFNSRRPDYSGKGRYQGNYNSRNRGPYRGGILGADEDDDFDEVFGRNRQFSNNRNSGNRYSRRNSFDDEVPDDYFR